MYRHFKHVAFSLSRFRFRPGRKEPQGEDPQQGRLLGWTAVFFGAGVAVYLCLGAEPPAWLAVVAALAAAALAAVALPALRSGRRAARFVAALLAAAALGGFCAAAFKGQSTGTRLLHAPLEDVVVEGLVFSRAPLRAGGREGAAQRPFRYGFAPTAVEGVAPEDVPSTVSLVHPDAGEPVAPGGFVRLRASLRPVPGPVEPGAGGLSERLWFAGTGAVGIVHDVAALEHPTRSLSWREGLAVAMAELRLDVLARIQAAVSGDSAGIAAALIVGERALISRPALQALRDSGLSHLLAISGLHMALVAGAFLWAGTRLSLLGPLQVSSSTARRCGALAAMLAIGFYLAVSGASISTLRAFVMVLVVLISLFQGRAGFSTGNVALAALANLALWPESLLQPGFQMSFAATLALVAVYENRHPWLHGKYSPHVPKRAWHGVRFFLLVLLLTTLVAGGATNFFAGHHFQRIVLHWLLANLLAIPFFVFLVMPMMLLSLLAMPFGLEAVPLRLLGAGGAAIVAIGAWVGGLPGAVFTLGPSFAWLLPLFALCLCWLCLWRGRWRFAGLGAMLLAFPLLGLAPRPVLLVSEGARAVAMLAQDGVRQASRPHLALREQAAWRRRDNRRPLADAPRLWKCREDACIAALPQGGQVIHAWSRASLARACAGVPERRRPLVVVSSLDAADGCAADIVIDGPDAQAHGIHAVFRRGGGLETERASDALGARPWSPYAARQ